jgi:hypothetical protein
MSLTSSIYHVLRLRNDLNAIAKGKVGNRLVNKGIGRLTGKMMRK